MRQVIHQRRKGKTGDAGDALGRRLVIAADKVEFAGGWGFLPHPAVITLDGC
jgi:hypothetical protein